VIDTLKRAVDGQVVETLDRSNVYAAQTPQGFVADALRRALDGGGADTDCAALVESRGGRVALVEGDPRLLKVTTPGDLAVAEALIGQSQ
jgi:2-C-methyl-D-erythritol 4-phosphate cytidylyltransferase